MVSHRREQFERRGFTLVEVLLTLSLILVATSIVVPSVMYLVHDRDLKVSVNDVRVELSRTRMHALDAGAIYQFRYEPGGVYYIVLPEEFDILENEQTQAQDTNAIVATQIYKQVFKLPEGFQFENIYEDLPVEQLPEDWLTGLPNKLDLQSTAWAPALLFYPDGTAEESEFKVVETERKQSMRLSVRGLTGAVTVSSIEAEKQ